MYHFHWSEILTGAGALGLLAHAVNTFPTPQNMYGRWFLGCLQWFVGQRVAGQNTMKGQDSTIVGTPTADRGQPVTAKLEPPTVISQSDKP